MLHTIQWTNLSPDGGDKPVGDLASSIDEHFGSFDAFQGQLSAATTLVQGSGWGVLVLGAARAAPLVEQVYDHHANIGQGPCLCW